MNLFEFEKKKKKKNQISIQTLQNAKKQHKAR